MNELFITDVDGSTRVMNLDKKTLLMGRDPSCELAFPRDAELSRRHLVMEQDGDLWAIRDLGSTNGTRVNGKPLSGRYNLQPGDTITASKISILFRTQGEPISMRPRTVVFETSKIEALSEGTVSVHLEDLLGSQEARPVSFTPGGKQWLTPLQALLRVGRELASRRPLQDQFPAILELALEAVNAERGVLMVLENNELEVVASSGGEFRISSTVRDRVIKMRESLMIQSVDESPSLKDRKSIIMQGVRSLMAVPLQTDERVIGLLYIDALNYLRRFTNDDLNLLTVMANVAAIRIERERLAEVEEAQRLNDVEMKQAAEVQTAYLPQAPPSWPGLEVAARHTPSRTVGGDCHDYFEFPDGRYGVFCADAAGKGMPAALMVHHLSARVHAMAETENDLGSFVARLNKGMNKSCPPGRFVTLFLCAFKPATGELTYTNAGHNPSLLIRSDGSVQQLLTGGLFVGLLPGLQYETETVVLQPGDIVVLYTDGITEEENPQDEEFGIERLGQMCAGMRDKSNDAMAASVFEAVSKWTEGAAAKDDQTIVILRRKV